MRSRAPQYAIVGGFLAELKAIFLARINKVHVIHILYTEENYALLSSSRVRKLLLKRIKVIGTVHQPASWWKVKGHLKLLNTLDGIIVLTEHDRQYLESELTKPVVFIPHGVDVDFFCPDENAPKQQNQFQCLFVGNWLRNIDLLVDIIEIAHNSACTFKFNILYPKAKEGDDWRMYQMARFQNVEFLHALSDEELKIQYRKANVLLLPLIDCSANNAILEAMACGLPIVTSDLEPIKSYVTNEFAALLPNKSRNFLAQLEGLATGSMKLNGSAAAKFAATNFGWDNISRKVLHLYQSFDRA
ncbi:glycosyltransferase family 4 protein [Imperialibacter roseus]|uniref:Glycosyltransferase family 4 protein n=1 Tax=Imperialibacter roseus TaxID=1324217 RepID=A0ABZ0INI3_9BACT|nr:glycosyltransferase family 4 protein [Imperialibacter roseus]WOK06286.1 glycosyltransferase family 4 protein [Imperialibacter roseus]